MKKEDFNSKTDIQKQQKEAKLAAQLRKNLLKRKIQARNRKIENLPQIKD